MNLCLCIYNIRCVYTHVDVYICTHVQIGAAAQLLVASVFVGWRCLEAGVESERTYVRGCHVHIST